MFDSLSTKLQNAFRNLRGLGKISESNASEALREVRQALLEADVNFKVARDFIERVKSKALGQEVVASVQPGQQVIKIIHDELVELLGSENAGLQVSGNPASLLLVGLFIGRPYCRFLCPNGAILSVLSRFSRRHAVIRIAGATATIEDCGSKNGTFVGDERVEGRRELSSGDDIRLGKAWLRFGIYPADVATRSDDDPHRP